MVSPNDTVITEESCFRRTEDRPTNQLIASNTRGLPNQALDAIASIMQKGYSMRQAKRMLGVTKKVPIINRLKNKK